MGKSPSKRLRLDKLALFARLGYEPHPGQLAVHQSDAPRRVVCCGTRWGKSRVATYEAIAGAMAPCENSVGWIIAPSYVLSDIVYQQVVAVVQEQLAHRVMRIESKERTITIRNLAGGVSVIRGRSADTPSNLLGASLDWAIIDEAALLSDNVWSGYIAGRLVDRRGWSLALSTPRGRDSWFFDMFQKGQMREDPDFKSWTGPSWQNPHIDTEAIELERGRVPERVFLQEYGAQFLLADGSLPCDTCGWPLPFSPAPIVLLPGMELQRCLDCGRFVNQRGEAIAGVRDDGEPDAAVIVVELPVGAGGSPSSS